MKGKLIFELICGLLIVLFVYTGLNKFTDHSFFSSQLSLYPLLKAAPNFFSLLIPAAELFISVLLFLPPTRAMGLIASSGILIVFTAYLCFMTLSGKNLPCSCGGVLTSMTWGEHIVFNSAFIMLGIAGIFLSRKFKAHVAEKE